MINNIKIVLTSFSAIVILAGCGGGGSSSSTSLSSSYTGTVVDGYVSGATVFADTNDNGILDTGEPTTVTKSDGSFTLPSGIKDHTTIYAIDGIDTSTGLTYTGKLHFSSSRVPLIISPITTYVASNLNLNSTDDDYDRIAEQAAYLFQITKSDINLDPMSRVDLFTAAQKIQRTAEILASLEGDITNDNFQKTLKSIEECGIVNFDIYEINSCTGANLDSSTLLFIESITKTIDDLKEKNITLNNLDKYALLFTSYSNIINNIKSSQSHVIYPTLPNIETITKNIEKGNTEELLTVLNKFITPYSWPKESKLDMPPLPFAVIN